MSLKISIDTGDAVRSADAFQKAIQRLAVSTKLMGGSADDVMRMTKSMARRFSAIAKAAGTVGEASEKASRGMDKVAKSTNKAGDAAARATSKTNKYASSIKTMIGAYVGIRSVRVVVKTLAELDQGLTTLGSVTASTSEELKVLEATAVRVAQATKFTPKETIRALLELSRAGQDAATAAESLASVTALAAAGVLDLGVAAGLTAATMAQYKSQNVGAAEVAATFVAVADRTKSTVLTLGSAMGQAGQAAAQFGINVEDTVIAIGTLQTAGIQASRSGRAIKTILSSLATANKRSRSRTAMEQMGLDAKDLIAQGGDLFGLFERLNKATKDMSAQKRVGILTSLVGKDFYAILAEAMGSIDNMYELQTKLGDKRAELLEKERQQNDTLSGSLMGVTSAYQEMLLVSGDSGLTGTLKDLFNTLSGSIRVIGGVEGGMAKASAASLTLLAVIKGIVAFGGLKLLGTAAAAFTVRMDLAAAATGRMATAQALLGKSTPWGLIAVGIAAAVTAISSYSSKLAAVAAKQKAIQSFRSDFNNKEYEFGDELASKTTYGKDKTSKQTSGDIDSSINAVRALKAALNEQRATNKKYNALRLDEKATTELRYADITSKSFTGIKYLTDQHSKDELSAALIHEGKLSASRKRMAALNIRLAEAEESEASSSIGNYSGRKDKTNAVRGAVEAEKALYDSLGKAKLVHIALQDRITDSALANLLKQKEAIQEVIAEEKKLIDSGGESGADNSALVELKSNALIADSRALINQALIDGHSAESELVAILEKKIALEKLSAKAREDGVETVGDLTDDVKKAYMEEIDFVVKRNTKLKDAAVTSKEISAKKRDDAAAERKAIREANKEAEAFKRAFNKSYDDDRERQKKLVDHLNEVIRLRKIAALPIEQQAVAIAEYDASKAILDLGGSAQQAQAGGAVAGSDVVDLATAATNQEKLDKAEAEAVTKIQQEQAQLEAIGQQVGSQFANAFDAIVSGSKSAKEAFADMARDMVKQLVQIAIKKAIVAAIGSAFGGGAAPAAANQQGGVINNQQGGTIPAQLGQIISSPTTIQRGGKNFSVSEGGGSTPEAVFPLVKNAKGQLGIGGAGGGGTVNHFNFPGIKSGEEARKAKRTMGQQVASVMAATQAKKNKAGMRPK